MIRVRYRLVLFVLLGVAGLSRHAAAEADPVQVRSGNHPDFGRVVFETSAPFRITREQDRILVRFGGSVVLGAAPVAPRNVLTLKSDGDQAELTIVPGATTHAMRLGPRAVLDVFDPKPDEAGKPQPPLHDPAGKAPRTDRPPDAGKPDANARPIVAPASPGSPATATHASASPAGIAAAPAGADRPAKDTGRSSAPATRKGPAERDGVAKAAAKDASVAKVPAKDASATAAGSPTDSGAATVAPQAADSGRSPAIAPATAVPTQAPDVAVSTPQPATVASGAAKDPAASARDGPPAADASVADPGTAPSRSPDLPIVPSPAAEAVVADAAAPNGLAARRVILPPGTDGAAISLPFSATSGAALFRRGDGIFAVFDERRPIDMAALRNDAVFGGATIRLAETGTILRLRPTNGWSPVLSHTAQGWTVALLPAPPSPAPIAPQVAADRLTFAAEQSNQVVKLADPDSGATLLVGTQRGAGQGVAVPRRTGEFGLPQTVQGVLVEPLSDSIMLRVIPSGFALTGAHTGLVVSPPGLMADVLSAAARLTRRFEFPALPMEALSRRMTRQIDSAAMSAPLARGTKRRDAAITMLSLGMAVEAESLLKVAAAEDPKEAASVDNAGLTAIAALLAGRPESAAALDDPRLGGTDDVLLWRAIRQAMADPNSASAAAAFRATAPLAFAYPPALRGRILPLILETMIRGGEVKAAEKLMAQRPDDPQLAFVRAMAKQADGDEDGALALYDALADGRDQLNRARASRRAVELRLASHKIDAKQAADALDKLLYVWRGDRHDLAARQRLAELRQAAGDWRKALSVLRDAETDFPDQAKPIRARLQATFATMLRDYAADKLPPLDLIAMVEENTDLLPPTSEGDALEERVADRLLALDLPKRADQVLTKLLQASTDGARRARFGARLATLRLRERDAAGALAALGASASANLPAPLVESRAMLTAEAYSKRGDVRAALDILATLSSPAADEARATILERAQDWAGAELALSRYVAKMVPTDGTLTDQDRHVLLRLATAAARAGDDAGLAELRAREEARIGTGPLGDMFRLLTADPIRGAGDLARSKREVGLARALPEGLAAFQPTTTH